MTNPWTSKSSSRFDCISAAHPHACLSPITMILCFFSFCLFIFFCILSLSSFLISSSYVIIGSHAICSSFPLFLSSSYWFIITGIW
jgi:hypothetical protein